MSVAAVMLVKDEVDIIETTVRHLLAHVDEVIVSDNGSTDGTRDVLAQLEAEHAGYVIVEDDPDVAYYQAVKTTALARQALARGHSWVVPCDADEIWYAPDGRALRDWLAGVVPDVVIVRADLYNHVPTVLDHRRAPNPVDGIRWRQREPQSLGKVCVRARPDVSIDMGNHSARTEGTGRTQPGLQIRHFPWRSARQYLSKIRNGSKAYAASTLPKTYGVHWRMFDGATDEAIVAHFEQWFFSRAPEADDSLVLDPAPVRS